jgi:hypothetical protein
LDDRSQGILAAYASQSGEGGFSHSTFRIGGEGLQGRQGGFIAPHSNRGHNTCQKAAFEFR